MDNKTNNWKEFTLGNPQEEPPKRVQKKTPNKKRGLWLALLIVVILAFLSALGVLPGSLFQIHNFLNPPFYAWIGMLFASVKEYGFLQ